MIQGFSIYIYMYLFLFCTGYDDTTLIQRFIDCGADIRALDAQGDTCLHLAILHGNIPVIRTLYTAGIHSNSIRQHCMLINVNRN